MTRQQSIDPRLTGPSSGLRFMMIFAFFPKLHFWAASFALFHSRVFQIKPDQLVRPFPAMLS